ncbi:MAG: hypothetical protein WB609_06845 [Candidatus Cybelea sp.]
MSTTSPSGEAAAAGSSEPTVGPEITSVLTSADATATQRVQHLSFVQQARIARQTRTVASVTAQYGAGSPQAKAAQDAVTATRATDTRVVTAKQQLATKAPIVGDSFALQGRVFDSQMQPAEGYTVFLVDAQNTYQTDYGFAYTDKTGYFLLRYGGKPPSGTPTPLFVSIADASAKPIFRGPNAFLPTPGRATYRAITLPAGAQPIGNPPPDVRKTGFPPPK